MTRRSLANPAVDSGEACDAGRAHLRRQAGVRVRLSKLQAAEADRAVGALDQRGMGLDGNVTALRQRSSTPHRGAAELMMVAA